MKSIAYGYGDSVTWKFYFETSDNLRDYLWDRALLGRLILDVPEITELVKEEMV